MEHLSPVMQSSDRYQGETDLLKVVLLEDESIDAEQISRLLAKSWPNVELFRFTRLAHLVEGLTTMNPDVIFCDMSVPDGQGIYVVEETIQAAGLTPVVVLTSNTDPTAPELALKAGAQDYLSKGNVDRETLSRTLRYSIARSEANQTMVRIDQDLRQLNAELDQYAGVVAHDLRAPLRTARLFADRLVAVTGTEGDAMPIADALDNSLNRMEILIARLLDLATLRDGALSPEKQCIRSILDDVKVNLSADIATTSTTVRWIDNGVSDDGVVADSVVADSVLVRELVGNLVQNSIKYRTPGRDPVIEVSLFQVGAETEIQVADNGIGIPDRYQDRVFGLFERLDPNHEEAGLGFGLAFCRRIVELHRGSIHIAQSSSTGGTVVCVRLPRHPTPTLAQPKLN